MGIVEQYFIQLNMKKQRFRRSVAILTVLSLLVILTVSWNLRQTGIAFANGANCGIEEHQHSEECLQKILICGFDDEIPTEEPTEAPTETFSEEATESPTDAPTEPPTEAPTEPPTEAPTEPPEEETAAEEVITAAADVLFGLIPTVHASEIPDESVTHIHTDACYEIDAACELQEHVHDFSCYCDETADLEDWDDWLGSIPELTGVVSEDMVLVAQSQLGCAESTLNFQAADDGETRNGITRYGQWYGNPYGPWSNMFTSFCLHFAGLTELPIHSGAEKMQMEWEELNLYRYAGSYEPESGDIVFLDKNQNGVPESTAVVVRYFDFVLTVIEGDVEDSVAEVEYFIDDPVITGYGVTNSVNKVMMFAATASDSWKTIGQTATYNNNLLTSGGAFIVYTTSSDGKNYAMDGNGNAVEIQISNGVITADVANQSSLYWTFEKASNYDNKSAYYIYNAVSGLYLHPNRDTGTAGSLHTGKWETALYNNGTGVRFRGARQDAYALLSGDKFTYSQTLNGGSTFYFGKAPSQISLWLDGTNGNIMAYRGSDNTKYTVYAGAEVKLPSTWESPTKYQYKLAGWVNITTGDYYPPGGTITVSENTVLYADWVAATYDIGLYNSFVANTVSTNDFVTTHVFDYSSLINLLSTKVTASVSDSSHSETWSHVASGAVSYKGQQTLNFSFNDHDSSGTITSLNNLNDPNKYTGGNGVYSGIYNAALGETLFGTDNLFDPETGEGVVGKHYLGQGDHLFQINTDPTSEYYGYYYYDAKLNAASYNQTDQRFYVYDYLARSSDSANNDDGGKYSDFLPLNSPYANTNGRAVKTYTYNGDNGEYSGITHYSYDARFDENGSSASQVIANLWFGMRVDVQFGLPDTPGVKLSDGKYGNKDIYGNDMHFRFTGDDDVWILVDGKVVLDLGGIHQEAEGEVNFSTGEVRVNGQKVGNLSGISAGEHTLSILYLERGSSMSNCGIYFNLAPRFSLTLQKEDVLTQEILNGAQFAFYTDQACTEPCSLWTSQRAYKNGEPSTNIFTIQNGKATIWGLSPSRTYYIREVSPPNASGYEPARGVIRLTLDKNGLNSYSATILEGVDEKGNKVPVSHGFTVHGFRIDEESQAAYLVITNAQNWVRETTSIYAEKKWNDSKDHTYDSVTVYLTVTDPDGTVRRIREVKLSEENDWKYTWTNLPKYIQDPETGEESTIPVKYGVMEAYVPGYAQSIKVLESGTYTEETWAESSSFVNGKEYILKTANGCLSTISETGNTLQMIKEDEARSSPLAIWKATVSSNLVKLTNQAGQSLNFYSSGATRYFNAATGSADTQNLTAESNNGGIRLLYKSGKTNYYLCALNKNNYADAKNQANSALLFYPMERQVKTTTVEIEGYGFRVTNTPLTAETSLKVTKQWSHPTGDALVYEKLKVTVKLLANGLDTGLSETIDLKSDWTAVFYGLPYMDADGVPYVYTVVESWDNDDWIPEYGQVQTKPGTIPSYEITVTNHYRWIDAFELPSTGGIGSPFYILIGLILMSAPFVYGFRMRRRYRKEASA